MNIRRIISKILMHFGFINQVTAHITYTHPNQTLVGKKIIVTGGGRGLGFAMAKKFKEEGAEVLIAGRNEDNLKKSAEKINCKFLMLDVQDVASFKSFLEKADELLGGINCLVNNAGISLHELTFLDVSEEQYDSQFETNLKGAFFLTQCFVDKTQGRDTDLTKNILFISSETSMTVDERPYGLTKAAINSLVQGLAYRYVCKGYRINGIAPGITVSDMTGNVSLDDISLSCNVTGRYYLPEEIANIASFMLSDVSNCLNGQILMCNEGRTINARWR